MENENATAFKLWINGKVVKKYLATNCQNTNEINQIIFKLNALEMRARVQLIANELKKYLHPEYPKALKQLLQLTRKQNMTSFELWPATEFIQIYGINHIDESLSAMYELTQKFTAEFCIRPFLNTHGQIIYKKLLPLKDDPNEHIRRWLSEGTRPRLPWGEKLRAAVNDPSEGLAILEYLKFDPSLYVRKSVANHLNDIAKDHPKIVTKTLQRWAKEVPENYENEFRFIIHRSLRTLIKNGDPTALKLVGVQAQNDNLEASDFKVSNKKIKIGDYLEFSFSVKNKSKQKIKFLIDFVIYYKKANGDLSPKVFKLKSGFINGGEKIHLIKKHSFKQITTRKYYKGEHQIALKINGHELPTIRFILN